MLKQLFGPFAPNMAIVAEHLCLKYPDKILTEDYSFRAYAFADGMAAADNDPRIPHTAKGGDLEVLFFAGTKDELFAEPNPKAMWLRVLVPTWLLFEQPKSYTLYGIRFNLNEPPDAEDAFGHPLGRGYIGITKRNPFCRFKEHHRDARSGAGHLLHKTWRSLIDLDVDMHVIFQIIGQVKTLDEVYRQEEILVAEHTLAPLGLNAIPGGMAGIKMMHQLRLLSSPYQVNPEERDRALVKLESESRRPGSPCAHYRSGHLRRLPTGKLTCVRACWVNPEIKAAA